MEEPLKISMAAARVNAKLTQSDIACKMSVSKQTIINWEKGNVCIKTGAAQDVLRHLWIE